MRSSRSLTDFLPDTEGLGPALKRNAKGLIGLAMIAGAAAAAVSLATWSVTDPSLNHAVDGPVRNVLGRPGAIIADLLMQMVGLAAALFLVPVAVWGGQLLFGVRTSVGRLRLVAWPAATIVAATAAACLPVFGRWPLPTGLGGALGDLIRAVPASLLAGFGGFADIVLFPLLLAGALVLFVYAGRTGSAERAESADAEFEDDIEDDDHVGDNANLTLGYLAHGLLSLRATFTRLVRGSREQQPAMHRPEPGLWRRLLSEDELDAVPAADRREPLLHGEPAQLDGDVIDADYSERVQPQAPPPKTGKRIVREAQPSFLDLDRFELPPLRLLAEPKRRRGDAGLSPDALEQNARLLEGVLEDFGVKGAIIHVRPGPVVTLYELEPAPGIKSSRVIGLADDIARSMSAISARVAVIPGKNAIGIELPNQRREMVFLRELLAAEDFEKSKAKLPLCLGKTINGEPVIADLARMPHLLIAGTTGSGKSVAINTMVLSLLYRLGPDRCKLIMIDPKMLELSVYDGIPHLLSPVVTDPKKAVVALKWTVREMEERYRRMSKLGVRNVDGYNTRVEQAIKRGEAVTRTIQTGFDRETGEAVYEQEDLDLEPMPFIVVIVDEMADLMMVAGKEIEGAIQRLAQMARAAGIHIVMATQRPSVDVITGTIKANFPTRISFQVTSKIDSRTILGEQGAEQLLGQGDMLYMAGGGRIKRVHGPFVADDEVEQVVAHLKAQGAPDYLDAVTEEEDAAAGDYLDMLSGGGGEGAELYDQAVAIVLRDRKASTSYIQRRLSIGYNRAASIIERMEQDGIVSPANHAGKREILVDGEEPEID